MRHTAEIQPIISTEPNPVLWHKGCKYFAGIASKSAAHPAGRPCIQKHSILLMVRTYGFHTTMAVRNIIFYEALCYGFIL